MKDRRIIVGFWIICAIVSLAFSIFFAINRNSLTRGRKIALIVNDREINEFEELEKGLSEEAALYNMDLNIDFMQNPDDVKEQKNIISQEISAGVGAIILIPVDEDEIKKYIEEAGITLPIVYIYSEHIRKRKYVSAGFDSRAMGTDLGKIISDGYADAKMVYFAKDPESTVNKGIVSGIESVLPENKVNVIKYSSSAEIAREAREYAKAGDKTVMIGDKPDAALALEKLAGFYNSWDRQIYSIGSNEMVLAGMENEKITGAMHWSSYRIGIESVRALSNIFRGIGYNRNIKVKHCFINRENMFEYIGR